MKDYLGYENDRNKKNAALYQAILRKAWGPTTDVLVGHHICTEQNRELSTENEIPSADTLMFDHDIMGKVFGDNAQNVMIHLALRTADERDDHLAYHYKLRYPEEELIPA